MLTSRTQSKAVRRNDVSRCSGTSLTFFSTVPILWLETQIELFDEIIGFLIQRIETKFRAELSERLSHIPNAPIKVASVLARDNEIAVARPILASCERLDANDLVEIAKTKSQKHLLAISGRRVLDAIVTDVLLDRGDFGSDQ